MVIVSNDGANARAESRSWCGDVVGTKVTRVLPFQTFLDLDRTGLTRSSKAQAEQVRSIDVGASDYVSDSCHQRSLWNSMTPCGCILACDESFSGSEFPTALIR